MNFEPLWLDAAVKWSRIATPFVLAISGWYVTNALNRRSHMTKLKSELHLEWTRKFIQKCFEFSDLLTSIQMKIYQYTETTIALNNMQELGNEGDEFKQNKKFLEKHSSELRSYTGIAMKLKYEIEVFSNFVDGSNACLSAVNEAFKATQENYMELKKPLTKIDFETTKSKQIKFLTELRKLQSKVLEI